MSQLVRIGQKFGEWTTVQYIPGVNRTKAKWFCKCSCGCTRQITTSYLLSGLSKSCGRHPRISTQQLFKNRLFTVYKGSAKSRKLSFELTKDQLWELSQQVCHYCGISPKQIHKIWDSHLHQYKDISFLYNGLDRADNNKGYSINNVVPCCATCNRAKLAMTLEDFYDWINRVYTRKDIINVIGTNSFTATK